MLSNCSCCKLETSTGKYPLARVQAPKAVAEDLKVDNVLVSRNTRRLMPLGSPQGSFTIHPEKPDAKYPFPLPPAAAAGERAGSQAVTFLGGRGNSAEVNSVASDWTANNRSSRRLRMSGALKLPPTFLERC